MRESMLPARLLIWRPARMRSLLWVISSIHRIWKTRSSIESKNGPEDYVNWFIHSNGNPHRYSMRGGFTAEYAEYAEYNTFLLCVLPVLCGENSRIANRKLFAEVFFPGIWECI